MGFFQACSSLQLVTYPCLRLYSDTSMTSLAWWSTHLLWQLGLKSLGGVVEKTAKMQPQKVTGLQVTVGEKVVNCVVWYQYFTAKFVLGTWKSGGPDAESGAYRPKKTDYANQLLVPWELTLFLGNVKHVTLEVMLRHWATSHQTTV